jgi:hypothetical protein
VFTTAILASGITADPVVAGAAGPAGRVACPNEETAHIPIKNRANKVKRKILMILKTP